MRHRANPVSIEQLDQFVHILNQIEETWDELGPVQKYRIDKGSQDQTHIPKQGCGCQYVYQLLIKIPFGLLRYTFAPGNEAKCSYHPEKILRADVATDEVNLGWESLQGIFNPKLQHGNSLFDASIRDHHATHTPRTRHLKVAIHNIVEKNASEAVFCSAIHGGGVREKDFVRKG